MSRPSQPFYCTDAEEPPLNRLKITRVATRIVMIAITFTNPDSDRSPDRERNEIMRVIM